MVLWWLGFAFFKIVYFEDDGKMDRGVVVVFVAVGILVLTI